MLLLRGNTLFYSLKSHPESEIFCWSHLIYFYPCPPCLVLWEADLCTPAVPPLSLPSWWVQPMGSPEGCQNVVRAPSLVTLPIGLPQLLRSSRCSHHTAFSFRVLVTAPSPPPEAQGSNLCLLCLLHCRWILYPLNHLRSPLALTIC